MYKTQVLKMELFEQYLIRSRENILGSPQVSETYAWLERNLNHYILCLNIVLGFLTFLMEMLQYEKHHLIFPIFIITPVIKCQYMSFPEGIGEGKGTVYMFFGFSILYI